MIIDYFNINGIALNPLETDTPLIIHSNAVLTFFDFLRVFPIDSQVESEDLVPIQRNL